MRPRDSERYNRIEAALLSFSEDVHPLPGVEDPEWRKSLIEQMLESLHRIEFIRRILSRPISLRRADANDDLFDPLKAAVLSARAGDYEEAIWLTFLFVHFGKHHRGGWRYVREVYGRLGDGRWDWGSASADPAAFRSWLNDNVDTLRRAGAGFGNHRKYESLDGVSSTGTGAVVESYIRWVGTRTQQQVFDEAIQSAADDPHRAFDTLFRSMNSIIRFGRTARFDFLTMLGKLGLANISPGSPYLKGATGPLSGAKLLFGDANQGQLERLVVELEASLHVGMQVMEDALCNWQKSPGAFRPFRG